MDTETNFVVTVGFRTKVDHQTTSKITFIFLRQFRYFIGLEEKKFSFFFFFLNFAKHFHDQCHFKGSVERSFLPSVIILIFTRRP